MNITLCDNDQSIIDALTQGVRDYNRSYIDEAPKALTLVAKDEQGEIVGGVHGVTIYQQFLIQVVWVSESERGSGLGRSLMQTAEEEAIKRGCVAAQVETLAFQAPEFYRKLGFDVVGQVSGIKDSPDRFFMLKSY